MSITIVIEIAAAILFLYFFQKIETGFGMQGRMPRIEKMNNI